MQRPPALRVGGHMVTDGRRRSRCPLRPDHLPGCGRSCGFRRDWQLLLRSDRQASVRRYTATLHCHRVAGVVNRELWGTKWPSAAPYDSSATEWSCHYRWTSVDQRELVERAGRGDHDAFAMLVGGVIARLDAAARLILHDPEFARHAVQRDIGAGMAGLAGVARSRPVRRLDPPRHGAFLPRRPAATSPPGDRGRIDPHRRGPDR